MILTVLFLLAGVALIVYGSDFLVEGASGIAKRCGISEFVIGLTIVGIGTSTPEMVVSWISAFNGNADMAVGNVIGSNIFNVFLILGVTALILPIDITPDNIRRDIPLNIFITLALIVFCMRKSIFGMGEDSMTRMIGVIMLVLFALYLYTSFKKGRTEDTVPDTEDAVDTGKKDKSPFVLVLMVIGGLAGLIAGGELFLGNATALARHFGVSDKFIAITLLAGGTSLPELATCVVAAVKKRGQMALGNIIGSNISNILLILGGASLIHPLSFVNINVIDLGFLLLSAVFLFVAYHSFTKAKLDRIEGVLLLGFEAAYIYFLVNAL